MVKVYVEGNDARVADMFIGRGWEIAPRVSDADLVQLTGGSDVDPRLYGEQEFHPYTDVIVRRDIMCEAIVRSAVSLGVPMVGICRGGQFLNVSCGGRMIQHVTEHAISGTHPANIHVGEQYYAGAKVTSTHHQMMMAGPEGSVIGTASLSGAKYAYVLGEWVDVSEIFTEDDTEVVWYESLNALCFQPHPEYVDKNHECQHIYFELLKHHFGLES